MAADDAKIIAVLGPTNTGKTHLAVERMCAHSSGMMGFPLRLLAREIYDRVVLIKGANQVALITGEERIEPVHARYFCCTAESMPVERDFAFVAIDEAQLGADPERGHIFTDRILHARGREETMILGSESLKPLIRKLLPDAEIITRPRFSKLSYAGAKKLSRLPKRSVIVGFSIEQVYVMAEMLRRLRGGAAVVMGALSPRTRNAQVAMFQSGEVDYLVATDAIGMGLNLDVTHVAFAGLGKYDGNRRRRLTVSEMAQIAGRAGRHQHDGSFGTLSGESSEFTPEEILAIENHEFAKLDWLYWRESRPRFDNLPTLIADLEVKPNTTGLRAAPEALDLDVLKRLAEMPDITALIRAPAGVARLWEVASLPDFRKMGAEFHARFVASLWPYLAQGAGFLPPQLIASEIARLDNVQGDVDTISARIAAIRTWTYIAHRENWLENAAAMAERARAVEENLSDALHDALRQRFVDKRVKMLLRKSAGDVGSLSVIVDDDKIVLVDGEDIGTLDGFEFRVDPLAKASDRKLRIAAADRHLVALLREKARKLVMSEDTEFAMIADTDRNPIVQWQSHNIGHLVKGRSLLQPVFRPIKEVAVLEPDALTGVVERAENWIKAQIEKYLGGVSALLNVAQDPAIDGQVRALSIQLAEAGGIAGRNFIGDAVAVLDKDARAAARKSGIVFGALDVYHHLALKPAAVRWRTALFSAFSGQPMPELPPESAVHLKEWRFASATDCRNAGFRRIGNEHVRIDLAERIIKKVHEARGQGNVAALDLALVTSLGLGQAGLEHLLRDAGFRPMAELAIAPFAVDAVPQQLSQTAFESETAVEAELPRKAEPVAEPKPTAEPAVEADLPMQAAPNDVAPPVLSYWRWVGIKRNKPVSDQPARKTRPARAEVSRSKNRRLDERSSQKRPTEMKKPVPAPTPLSSLALQLAALQMVKKP
jgi:ATP-dependent RNA helicase SUPV3L1/SUV3